MTTLRRSWPGVRHRPPGIWLSPSSTPWVRFPANHTKRFGRGATRSASRGCGTQHGFRGWGSWLVTASAPPLTRLRKSREENRGWRSVPPRSDRFSSRSWWKSTRIRLVFIRDSHHSTPTVDSRGREEASQRTASSTRELGRPRLNQKLVSYVRRKHSPPKPCTPVRKRRKSAPGTASSWTWMRLTGRFEPCRVRTSHPPRRKPCPLRQRAVLPACQSSQESFVPEADVEGTMGSGSPFA
jgi:hypothetical protein